MPQHVSIHRPLARLLDQIWRAKDLRRHRFAAFGVALLLTAAALAAALAVWSHDTPGRVDRPFPALGP